MHIIKEIRNCADGFENDYSLTSFVFLCTCGITFQIERDRLHGKADLGQSAVVYSTKRRRIDVDTDDLIFHLKVIFNILL